MTDRKWLCNRKKQGSIEVILFIFVFSLMLTVFWNQQFFDTDEGEIFAKGQAIAHGMLLYKDIGSQHMPLMYYIAAFFSLFGVNSITGFRLCFYFLMAVLWGLMYVKYKQRFGRWTMVCYPLLYVIVLPTISMGTTILSEQFAGIGLAILLFELLNFQKTKKLYLDSYCMISLGIFLSFGSAFVTIFAIFSVGITFFLIEIRDCRKEEMSIKKSILHFIKEYWKLICIVILPWAILLGYYVCTHTLDDFYGWAYLLNRLVYPKYIAGSHYGSSIINAFFCGLGNIKKEFEIQDLTTTRLTQFLLLFMTLIFFIRCWHERRDAILLGGVGLFVVTAATRGVMSFHGLGVVAVLCAMGGMYLPEIVEHTCNKITGNYLAQGCILFCVLGVCSPYIATIPNLFNLNFSNVAEEGTTSYYIDLLTQKNERIGIVGGSNEWLLQARLMPASVTSATCGWMWEWGRTQAMEELTANPPRLYYFNRDANVWGYSLAEYAPEMIDYIDQNYTSLRAYGQSNLYVRNDTYMEAVTKIDSSVVFATDAWKVGTTCNQGQLIEQMFSVQEDCLIDAISLMTATYERTNYCTLNMEITDIETGKQIWVGKQKCQFLEDNALNKISVGHINLDAEKQYKLSIESLDASENQVISLYHSDEKSTEKIYCAVNGVPQDYNLTLEIHKADPSIIFSAGAFELGEPLLPGHVVMQTFYVGEDCTATSLGLVTGTYERINRCNLNFNLNDVETGELIWEGEASCQLMRDNTENLINMDPVRLLAGHSYALSITSPDATAESVIVIYHSGPNITKSNFASVDGEPQKYNLAINIYQNSISG